MEKVFSKKGIFDEVTTLYTDIFMTLFRRKNEENNWSDKTLVEVLQEMNGSNNWKTRKNEIKQSYTVDQRNMTMREIEEKVHKGGDVALNELDLDRKFMFFLIKDLCDFKEVKSLEKVHKSEKYFDHKFNDELENFKDSLIDNVDICYNALKKKSELNLCIRKEELIMKIHQKYDAWCRKSFPEHLEANKKDRESSLFTLNQELNDLLKHRQPSPKHDFKKYLVDMKVKQCSFKPWGIIEEEGIKNFNCIFELLKVKTKADELFIVYSSNQKQLKTVGLSLVAEQMKDSHIIHIKCSEVEDTNYASFFEKDKVLQELSKSQVALLPNLDIFFLFEFLGDLKDEPYFLLKDVRETFCHRKHIVITDKEEVQNVYDFMKEGTMIKLFRISE